MTPHNHTTLKKKIIQPTKEKKLRTLQDFIKTRQIPAKRHRSATTISFEPVRKKFKRNERYVGVIHSLQVDTFLVRFEIGTHSWFFDRWREKDGSE